MRVNSKPLQDFLQSLDAAVAAAPPAVAEQLRLVLTSKEPGVIDFEVEGVGMADGEVVVRPGPRLERFLKTLVEPEVYDRAVAEQLLARYLEDGWRGFTSRDLLQIGLDPYRRSQDGTEEEFRRRIAEILGGRSLT